MIKVVKETKVITYPISYLLKPPLSPLFMSRMLQVNSMLQKSLGQLLSENIEVPFEYLISITRIKCSSDLNKATAYISVMPFDKSEEALKFLIGKRNEIRGLLGKKIHLKRTPQITFRIDDTEEFADKLYQGLDNIEHDAFSSEK